MEDGGFARLSWSYPLPRPSIFCSILFSLARAYLPLSCIYANEGRSPFSLFFGVTLSSPTFKNSSPLTLQKAVPSFLFPLRPSAGNATFFFIFSLVTNPGRRGKEDAEVGEGEGLHFHQSCLVSMGVVWLLPRAARGGWGSSGGGTLEPGCCTTTQTMTFPRSHSSTALSSPFYVMHPVRPPH